MINLRFHIVSVVAVFLALALGIFTGSTLLDRATVDYLKSSRDRVDSRNAELSDERDRLLDDIEHSGEQMDAFGAEALPSSVAESLVGEQVLLLASGGVDTNSIRAVQDTFIDAGATGLGIIWIDERMDLDNPAVLRDVAESLQIDPDGTDAELRNRVINALSASLSATASAPISDPLAPALTTPFDGSDATSPTAWLGYWADLVRSGLIEWDDVDGSEKSGDLPDSGTRLVFISGSAASLDNETLMYPLISTTDSEVAPAIVGEVLEPISPVERAQGDAERGTFVNPLRDDEAERDRLVTIDNLDMPFGRLAAVFAASVGAGGRPGAFGEAPSASRSFPSVSSQDG